MNIALCGMMGSGKTTVAAELCRLTGMPWVDTDDEIVREYGAITDIFANFGEAKFREIESLVTERVSGKDGVIISTGGGCVLFERNVKALKQNAKIVFLRASEEVLIKRLEGDTTRPLLAGGAAKRVKELLPIRTPRYEAAADIIIDTDGLTPCEIAKEIISLVGIS